MSTDDFCNQYIDDMLNCCYLENIHEYHGNISYRNNIFYSWKMPICQHFMMGSLHYFEIVDKEESPSGTTTKHINKLLRAIQKRGESNSNIYITYVQEIVKREKRNELD